MPQANELDLFNASDQAPPMIPTSVTHMDIIVPIKDSPPDISYFDVVHSWLKVLLNLVLRVDVNYFSCLTPKEATPGFEPGTIQVYTGGVNHYTI